MTTSATPKAIQWQGNNEHGWSPCGATTPELPPAIYTVRQQFSMFGPGPMSLIPINPLSDKPILVDDGVSARVFAGVKKFMASKALYTEFGLLHKRGVMLEGAPGTGKTVTCMMLCRDIVETGGFGLYVPAGATNQTQWALSAIREVHPDAPIVNIFEDIDRVNKNQVLQLLALLDGENQVQNIIHIATTNYIDKLDARFTNRPSRFDEIIKITAPSAKARESYMTQIIPTAHRDTKTITRLVKVSEGLMLAHLRELVISTLVLGHPVEDTAKRLIIMNQEALTVPTTKTKTDTNVAPYCQSCCYYHIPGSSPDDNCDL